LLSIISSILTAVFYIAFNSSSANGYVVGIVITSVFSGLVLLLCIYYNARTPHKLSVIKRNILIAFEDWFNDYLWPLLVPPHSGHFPIAESDPITTVWTIICLFLGRRNILWIVFCCIWSIFSTRIRSITRSHSFSTSCACNNRSYYHKCYRRT